VKGKEQTWQQWARAVQRDPNSPSRIEKGSLAGLTGIDVRALDVFAAAMKLYAATLSEGALYAAHCAVAEMQPKMRWVAKELIPFALCWDDRERLWPRIMPQATDDEDDVGLGNPLARSHP